MGRFHHLVSLLDMSSEKFANLSATLFWVLLIATTPLQDKEVNSSILEYTQCDQTKQCRIYTLFLDLLDILKNIHQIIFFSQKSNIYITTVKKVIFFSSLLITI